MLIVISTVSIETFMSFLEDADILSLKNMLPGAV